MSVIEEVRAALAALNHYGSCCCSSCKENMEDLQVHAEVWLRSLLADYDRLARENEALREALKRYGEHLFYCQSFNSQEDRGGGNQCDCGLDDALRPGEAGGEGR